MKFLSVCSGIEAASVAWSPLGWKAWAFSEIDRFACAVLAHHYPDTPNLGDMTKFKDWPDATFDLLCGGTPCQSFSTAGQRGGLDDPRGQLMPTFGAIAARYQPRWLVWENVPGVLSSNRGQDFGAFLGLLAQLGYGFAYRVLDAQYVRVDGFGRAVPQRRRRVFVVGHLGDWRRAAAVLLEPEGLRGNPPPRRASRVHVAGHLARGPDSSRGARPSARRRDDGPGIDRYIGAEVAHTLLGEGFDAGDDGRGRGTPLVVSYDGHAYETFNARAYSEAIVFDPTQITRPTSRFNLHRGDPSHTLTAGAGAPAIAFQHFEQDADGTVDVPPVPPLPPDLPASTAPHVSVRVKLAMRVRKLTPMECERLMGFPDHYTAIPYRGSSAKDSPRYRALGNSWAVNCARWVGRRIALVDALRTDSDPNAATATD